MDESSQECMLYLDLGYSDLFGLLRFVCYHHYTIPMLVYCTAMYKLCDCWKKNVKKSSYPKSIVKYHSEDRKVSEGAMISCQNGRKFARMYAVFGFGLLRFVWVTQICLLSSLYYFHVSILYSHV